MKKNIWKTFALILFFATLMPCFSSCSGDLDGCGLTVIVMDAITGERVADAAIHVSQGSGTIYRDGKTNHDGEAKFMFDHEAIFNINASIGEAPNVKNGSSTVRLKFGEVITKEVLVQ